MTIGSERYVFGRMLDIVRPDEGVGDSRTEIKVLSHYAVYELNNEVNQLLANNWKIIQGLQVVNRTSGNLSYSIVMGRYKGSSDDEII